MNMLKLYSTKKQLWHDILPIFTS